MTGIGFPAATVSPNRAVDHFSAALSQPVRALDTVYHNTDTTARFVVVCVQRNATGDYDALQGDADPPTTVVADRGTANVVGIETFSMIVPPGKYYEVATVAATVTLHHWTEWLL